MPETDHSEWQRDGKGGARSLDQGGGLVTEVGYGSATPRCGVHRLGAWVKGRQMDGGLAVFFDIGDTLASAVVEAGRLSRLDVYRFIPDVLARLRAGGEGVSVSLGLISNTGGETAASMNQVLADAGLLALVDARLCLFSSVEGLDKSQPAFFELARDRAAVPAARCLFVGENSEERAVAASVGFRVSPHPLHCLHLFESEFLAQPHA